MESTAAGASGHRTLPAAAGASRLAAAPPAPCPARAPIAFLDAIRGRSEAEKPVRSVVAGHPAEGRRMPVIREKALEEKAVFL